MIEIAFISAWICGVCALLAVLSHAGVRQNTPEQRDFRTLRLTFALGCVVCAAGAGVAWWFR